MEMKTGERATGWEADLTCENKEAGAKALPPSVSGGRVDGSGGGKPGGSGGALDGMGTREPSVRGKSADGTGGGGVAGTVTLTLMD